MNTGEIVGPWATVGTATTAKTDYATYIASAQVVPANFAVTAENT